MSKHGPRYGTYDDYDRPFEVDPPLDTSPLADPPEWKKPDHGKEHWDELDKDWKEQPPYQSTDFSTTGLTNDEMW